MPLLITCCRHARFIAIACCQRAAISYATLPTACRLMPVDATQHAPIRALLPVAVSMPLLTPRHAFSLCRYCYKDSDMLRVALYAKERGVKIYRRDMLS